jgi:Skp family chaperone for outer membrane proteins
MIKIGEMETCIGSLQKFNEELKAKNAEADQMNAGLSFNLLKIECKLNEEKKKVSELQELLSKNGLEEKKEYVGIIR